MNIDSLLAKAKALVDKPVSIVGTADLQDYIGCSLNTPLGSSVIRSVGYAYTRRVNNTNYQLYTITTDTLKITTYAHTQWSIY